MSANAESPGWQTPVGTLLPYLGAETGPLAEQGWLLCDGRTVETKTYPALSAVLGAAYGQAPPGSFRLPDHRGYFQRGRDANAGRDPDVAERTAQNGGTAVGDAVGSVLWRRFAPTAELTLYANGVPVAAEPFSVAELGSYGSNRFQIGACPDGSGNPREGFVGQLCEVRV